MPSNSRRIFTHLSTAIAPLTKMIRRSGEYAHDAAPATFYDRITQIYALHTTLVNNTPCAARD